MRIKSFLLTFALLIAFRGHNQVKESSPVIIEGKVIDEKTSQPVKKAHVYVLAGEEEALTNDKGEFRIQSWQKLPVRLTAESYMNHCKTTVVITDASKKQVIRLKIKPD